MKSNGKTDAKSGEATDGRDGLVAYLIELADAANDISDKEYDKKNKITDKAMISLAYSIGVQDAALVLDGGIAKGYDAEKMAKESIKQVCLIVRMSNFFDKISDGMLNFFNKISDESFGNGGADGE